MSTSSELTARRVFVVLFAIALLLLAVVIRPFAIAFFLAAVLAGALSALHDRFTRGLRGRGGLSAGLLTAAVFLVLVLPLGGITAVVVKEAGDGYRYVSETLRSEGVTGLVEKLPDRVKGPVRRLMDRFNVAGEDLNEVLNRSVGQTVQEQGATAAKAVSGAVAATGSFVLQVVMMLAALYFLLVDGRALLKWLEGAMPLEPGQMHEFFVEFRNVSVAVLVSTLATAGVQAVAALVGYLIARVPSPLFFAIATFVLALVPMVGAAVVCLAAAGLLFLTGHPWMALFLAIWAFAVVGVVDNVVKPLLVRRGMSMHVAVAFFALLGGLAAFGAVGLLLGPMIVSFFLALVRIYQRDYGAKPPPAQPVNAAEPAPAHAHAPPP